jgi:hypothetical protein
VYRVELYGLALGDQGRAAGKFDGVEEAPEKCLEGVLWSDGEAGTVSKRFVVRAGPRERYAFEFSPVDIERDKYRPVILYSTEVPDAMALAECIALYKSGVRAKASAEGGQKKFKPLAEILRIKRENKKKGFGIVYNERDYLEE